jgi:hypothetical protein
MCIVLKMYQEGDQRRMKLCEFSSKIIYRIYIIDEFDIEIYMVQINIIVGHIASN